MSKAKDKYYEQKKICESFGGQMEDITNYVEELEEKNKEMLDCLIKCYLNTLLEKIKYVATKYITFPIVKYVIIPLFVIIFVVGILIHEIVDLPKKIHISFKRSYKKIYDKFFWRI